MSKFKFLEILDKEFAKFRIVRTVYMGFDYGGNKAVVLHEPDYHFIKRAYMLAFNYYPTSVDLYDTFCNINKIGTDKSNFLIFTQQ